MTPTQPTHTTTEVSEASLDERMAAAGMIPLSKLLAGDTPLEKWMAHTSVRDLASFEAWLLMRQREFMHMRVAYELGDKDKTDEMYEWVFAHTAAFGEVISNFRAALSPGDAVPGMVLVPKRPTMAMLNAAVDHTGAGSDMDWNGLSPQSLFQRAWFAMLSAASSTGARK